jgi:hypothetical protein
VPRVRYQRKTGYKWLGRHRCDGAALIPAFARTEPVGVAETPSGDWLVRYADVELGYIIPAAPAQPPSDPRYKP